VDLLYDAAHELRSPLAYLKGYGELIANGRIEVADLRRIGERIRLQASRLSETVDDILELARIEAHGGANFKLRLHSISQLMGDALDALGPERSERIEIQLPSGSIPHAWVDRSKLCRALVNVFDNACKYSPSDTPITVRIGVRGGAGGVPTRVSVHVRDHGLGMERKDAQRAFERFPCGVRLGAAWLGLGPRDHRANHPAPSRPGEPAQQTGGRHDRLDRGARGAVGRLATIQIGRCQRLGPNSAETEFATHNLRLDKTANLLKRNRLAIHGNAGWQSAMLPERFVIQARHDDHLGRVELRMRTQLSEKLESVHRRHPQIRDQDCGSLALDEQQGLKPILGCVDIERQPPSQHRLEIETSKLVVVLNDQDIDLVFRPWARATRAPAPFDRLHRVETDAAVPPAGTPGVELAPLDHELDGGV